MGWEWGILASSGGGAAGAYELISSTILTSTASSVTFSSIPSTYKHLQIRWVARGSDTYLYLTCNADSTDANYRSHWLKGNGSTVASGTTASGNYLTEFLAYTNNTANAFTAGITDVLDYNAAKTTTVKTLAGVADNATYGTKGIGLFSGMRDSTAEAITSLTFKIGGTLDIGSRFSLYGIKG